MSLVARKDWLRFDSSLEAKVYLDLRRVYGELILIHYKLPVIPPPNGAYWNVDFFIPSDGLIVEAKGSWIQTFEFSDAKALLLLRVKLATRLGFKVLLVGSENTPLGENVQIITRAELNGYFPSA